MENEIKCSKCGSTQLTTNKKGFGLGKALIGGALTGGIGLLAGFIGSGKVKITCLKCGNSWTAGK
jgi:tellurium resistance protein TerD